MPRLPALKKCKNRASGRQPMQTHHLQRADQGMERDNTSTMSSSYTIVSGLVDVSPRCGVCNGIARVSPSPTEISTISNSDRCVFCNFTGTCAVFVDWARPLGSQALTVNGCSQSMRTKRHLPWRKTCRGHPCTAWGWWPPPALYRALCRKYLLFNHERGGL